MLFRTAVCCLITLCIAIAPRVAMAEGAPIMVVDPNLPSEVASLDIIVTAVPIGMNPGFIELHNQTDRPVDLTGRFVVLDLRSDTEELVVSIPLPSGYLLADSYLALGQTGVVADADVLFELSLGSETLNLFSVSTKDADGTLHVQLQDIKATATKYIWAQRKGGKSGEGTEMANMTQKTDPVELRGRGFYVLPSAPPSVQIVEIVAAPASCAPNDTSLVCGDYIKLHNPSDKPVNLANYRLRTDSGTSLLGNAFLLGYSVPANGYLTVHLRDDGGAMNLTNSGGYLWMEDAAGVKRYGETIVSYPDASSTTKQGWAWALDADGLWKWTSTPQPDAPNKISLPSVRAVVAVDEPAPCAAGKYRNPETGRCKNIEEAIATLVACDEGQYRNPETSRCRNIVTATSATLVPCDEGQERNPATNRCRSVLASSTTALAACAEGQERNPETNRCRNIVSTASPPTFSDPAGEQLQRGVSSYWFGVAALAGAAGYGVYEWRGELWKVVRRFVPKFGGK